MHKKRRLASGKNVFKKASVPEHCMFTRLMPGVPACILHIWCNNKTNLPYFQSLHASWGAHLLKNPSRVNRFKWYHTDNHHSPPSKLKPHPKEESNGRTHSTFSLGLWQWTAAALTQQKVTHSSLFQALKGVTCKSATKNLTASETVITEQMPSLSTEMESLD